MLTSCPCKAGSESSVTVVPSLRGVIPLDAGTFLEAKTPQVHPSPGLWLAFSWAASPEMPAAVIGIPNCKNTPYDDLSR